MEDVIEDDIIRAGIFYYQSWLDTYLMLAIVSDMDADYSEIKWLQKSIDGLLFKLKTLVNG